MEVNVIGAGLAGSEAAFQLANRGIKVNLYEMRPKKFTPAHHTDKFGELVCSNSLRSNLLENAVGLLKEELRILKSLIMECADKNSVPAGGALAVDRESFSECITKKILNHPNIKVIRQEVTKIDTNTYTIIATGPLTSDALSEEIKKITNSEYFYFYDAAAPIVTYESINLHKVFKASRYGKGEEEAYINCPMNKEEYDKFYFELINAQRAEIKSFEKQIVFEGCMPVEKMAERGINTLLYGPLKPVGLIDPRTGKQPYAVVQLRRDNADGTLYNIVGFQTNLKWGEQKRVFGLIPGLENAEFVRYGVMHRNTYINSTKLLLPTLQMKKYPKIMFAGQITGVEGYIESTSMGMLAGINMARIVNNQEPFVFPLDTAIGSLARYISNGTVRNFQPMNINFGIIPPIKEHIKDKRLKNLKISENAISSLRKYVENNRITID
ncbi:methylenetetrahydrofolate--tRNA-(uracil(54)-C(5))-methyltransferase (FADH(2)-oxidizing) TrmFO [Caloramator sp. E03]|uniref:methylenetetrahydrofolate--tRNA-(uracil(54)- C(5))-methyltransferase (FADH(2)-oxidizing) TrmFO n=1 Tax=Caloramator sp. E03 TaxID=2576307 RepID=UPI001110A92D|nr:methylenetetrahydrofolate--tRNA-(uracil(54)-C(5))-methyltransferase (FADH(2)-oxidizing) TrmFO [Caloramator sp. E03]QCX32261.1 methylenetetrahydrofolate--tRNA-(uracil(54)-C(5))-methyltransferase (FADH(2)-oxidizing) TrmFO [Caloramator sp. E03]